MAAIKKLLFMYIILLAVGFAKAIPISLSIDNSEPNISAVTSTNVNLYGITEKMLWCNATIIDNNGYVDIQNVNATFWNPEYSTESGSDNVYEHYTNKSCQFENKSATTVYASCLFNLSYKANVGRWICKIHANDTLSSDGSNQINIAVYKCGDNVCTYGENCYVCPSDCGRCTTSSGGGGGIYIKESVNETLNKTTAEKNISKSQQGKESTFYCGDGICTKEETCENCQEDCGACPPVKSEKTNKEVPLQSDLMIITLSLIGAGILAFKIFQIKFGRFKK